MHGALQPENIVVGDFGELLVLGWTYAIVMAENTEAPLKGARVRASGEALPPPTTTCTAPEQASGTGVFDERADIYALGAILYWMLGYEPPFPEQDEAALSERILAGHITPPQVRLGLAHTNGSEERLRNRLVEIAMKALSPSPESRHANVSELQAELAAWQDGLTVSGEHAKKWKVMLARRH
jgi:serine/threonine-protein kinase